MWGVLRHGTWEPCGKPAVDYFMTCCELDPEYKRNGGMIIDGKVWYCAEHWDHEHK